MKFTITEFKAACKENGVDPIPIIASLKKGRETAEKRPFWAEFIQVWFDTYFELRNEIYIMVAGDEKSFTGIYDTLKKRAQHKGFEWAEKVACDGFRAYILRAPKHADFFNQNLTPSNLYRHFNSIANSNGTTKTPGSNNDYANRLAQRITG